MQPTIGIAKLAEAASCAAGNPAWRERGMIVAIILAAAVALSLNVADPDLWGHVQYGRDALAHGLPRTTTYSYVAEGYPWINHEILAEYALAAGDAWFGGPGLLIAKCLLGVAVIGAILRRGLKQGAGTLAVCGLALLVAVALGNHWSLRPQLISYASFTLLLALLSYAFAGWERSHQGATFPCWRELLVAQYGRWRKSTATPSDISPAPPALTYSIARLKALWLAVPLFVVWTNSHGGFLAGLAVFIAYLGLRGFEAALLKGRQADGLIARFALMGGAAILATFLNPYGPLFHAWLFDDLIVPRPEIVEWRAPELLDTQFVPFWLLVGLAGWSLVRSRERRDWTQLTILGLILWQALTHHRHIAFFAIACGWWLPVHFDSALRRLGLGTNQVPEPDAAKYQAPAQQARREGLAFGAALIVAIAICGGQLAYRLSTLKVERDIYPVDAFEYIARQGLTGKMVCTFNWAQYALAAFGSENAERGILVQVDGRCRTSYSQAKLDMHFDFILGPPDAQMRYRDPRSGPYEPARALDYERPDLVLISRQQGPSVDVMKGQSERWVLLYQDALAQLWGRRSRYDDQQSAYYVPPSQRQISNQQPQGYAKWPALPDYQPRLHGQLARGEVSQFPETAAGEVGGRRAIE